MKRSTKLIVALLVVVAALAVIYRLSQPEVIELWSIWKQTCRCNRLLRMQDA